MTIIRNCPKCEKPKKQFSGKFCNPCYRRFIWKRKKVTCNRCHRKPPHHAQGFCAGCYNFIFHLERFKAINYKKMHNIDLETYKEITKKCTLCKFDKVIELHHLDDNRKNNSRKNLIGLCPNQHKMIHNYKFRKKFFRKLRSMGYKAPGDPKLRDTFD